MDVEAKGKHSPGEIAVSTDDISVVLVIGDRYAIVVGEGMRSC